MLYNKVISAPEKQQIESALLTDNPSKLYKFKGRFKS